MTQAYSEKNPSAPMRSRKKYSILFIFQRIYYYLETFPCLLVEHFDLGLLTWKDDVRNWFIGNSETPYQLVEPYVHWKYRNNKVTSIF